jgi:V/A-type H+-transporting ATPase subunit K
MTPRLKVTVALVALAGVFSLAASALLFWPGSAAAQPAPHEAVEAGVLGWGYLSAALATGLSSLGAGFAVASVGAAAIGALAEKPELLGRLLILVGLAEGIAIYGLIVSVLILDRLG